MFGAQFLEPVQTVQADTHQALLFYYQQTQHTSTSPNQVFREALRVPVGLHTYRLAVRDDDGASMFFIQMRVLNELGFSLVQPSAGGFSDQDTFDLVFVTDVPTQCVWDYYTPFIAPQWKETASYSSGILHEIESFNQHQFIEGETVPIIISCEDGNRQNATYIVPVGWHSGESQPVITQFDHGAIDINVQSPYPYSCNYLPGGSRFSIPSYQHHFQNIQPGSAARFLVHCMDEKGQEIPQQEVAVRQQNDFQMQVLSPTRPTNDTTVVLSVRTNMPATCTQDFDLPQAMSSDEARTLHTRHFTLAHGEHNGVVTCEAGTQTLRRDVRITVDQLHPRVEFLSPVAGATSPSPIVCEDTLIAGVRGNDAAYLVFDINGQGIMREVLSEQINLYRFPLLGDVSDGDTLYVYAMDEAGNVAEPISTTVRSPIGDEVDFCETVGRDWLMQVVRPTDAGTTDEEFDVELRSTIPVRCTFTVNNEEIVGSERTRQHIIPNFHDLTDRETITPIQAACEDVLFNEYTETFDISWQMPPPILEVTASPEIVSNPRNPRSTITVTADQEVRCSYDDSAMTRSYATEHEFEIVMTPADTQREVTVQCQNRAGTLSEEETITIGQNFPSDMNIVVNTPTILRTTTFTLDVGTNLRASCSVSGATETSLSTSNGFEHSQRITLAEGRHTFNITCADHFNQESTQTLEHRMILDRTRPTINIEYPRAMTCGLTELAIIGDIRDNLELDTIRVEFNDNMYYFDSAPMVIPGLNMTAGTSYRYTVFANDTAGNERSVTIQFVARDRDHRGCDTEAPVGSLEVESSVGSARYRLICTDNIACTQTFRIGTSSPDGTCNPSSNQQFTSSGLAGQSRSDWFTTDQDRLVCWRVFDTGGNRNEGSEVVRIQPIPEHCSDGVQNFGETGVDCGGPCPPCGSRPECESDQECEPGLICRNNYCDDPICQDDEECDPGQCVGGRCNQIACQINADCGENRNCVDGRCEPVPCTNDNQCGSAICEEGFCTNPQCTEDSQCTYGPCDNGRCPLPACGTDEQCEDGECIGGFCEGSGCDSDDDCQDGRCIDGACGLWPLHCFDGVQNFGETGVDCGGPCPSCPTRPPCEEDSDCANGVCEDNTCVDVGCTDDSQCGTGQCVGGVCNVPECSFNSDCPDGDCVDGFCEQVACTDDDDCGLGVCEDNTCVNPTCTDDDDCDYGACDDGRCPLPACTRNSQCTSGICVGGFCAPTECQRDADCESDICVDGVCREPVVACVGVIQPDGPDCGGAGTCDRCEVGQRCIVHTDCASNACFSGTCQEPTCEDGRRNQGETDVDCGGPCEPCEEGSGCETDADCDTGICRLNQCITREVELQEPGQIDSDDEATDIRDDSTDSTGRPGDTSRPTDQDTRPRDDPLEERSANIFGILLIILGFMSIFGGSGYMYWEKTHGVPTTKSTLGASTKPSGPQSTLTAAPVKKEPEIDFSESKLREEARDKKRSERKKGRKHLLKHFEDEKK